MFFAKKSSAGGSHLLKDISRNDNNKQRSQVSFQFSFFPKTTKMISVKLYCTLIFVIICVSGFVFQLYKVSEVYFKYSTTSKIEVNVRETETYQTIIFCPRFPDLLDRSRFKEFGILPHIPQNFEDMATELAKLTIKDILQLTPSTSNVIDTCLDRDSERGTTYEMNKTECYKIFTVLKAVNGERICYIIMPRTMKKYSVGDVASSMMYMNVVYEFILDPIFGKTLLAYFITDFVDPENIRNPLYSRLFAARMLNLSSFNKSKFSVYGKSTEITRLPPPHETNCLRQHDRQFCYEDCLIKKFTKVNRVPWSAFISEQLDLHMFTPKDWDNSTRASLAAESLKKCHDRCKLQTECYTAFTETSVVEVVDNINYGNNGKTITKVASMVPSGPHTTAVSVPLLSLVEYIIQVGSCFGVWFGLSIISFNPVKWKILQSNLTTERNVKSRRLFTVSKIQRFTS